MLVFFIAIVIILNWLVNMKQNIIVIIIQRSILNNVDYYELKGVCLYFFSIKPIVTVVK